MRRFILPISIAVATALFSSCSSNEQQPKTPPPPPPVEKHVEEVRPVEKADTIRLTFKPDSVKWTNDDRYLDTLTPGDGCDCPTEYRHFYAQYQIYYKGKVYGAQFEGSTYLRSYSSSAMRKQDLDTATITQSGLSYEDAKKRYQILLSNQRNYKVSVLVHKYSDCWPYADSVIIRDKNSKILLESEYWTDHAFVRDTAEYDHRRAR